MNNFFSDFDVIYSYSRKQALEDNVLVDISDVARRSDFLLPTAISSNLLAVIDAENQLPVLLAVFHDKMKFRPVDDDMITTQTLSKTGRVLTVHLHIGPGDDGEPVFTLMLPEDN